MANVPIKVPGVGESISEGILARWMKSEGDYVKSGEPLFELETDKASNVVPAPADGTLKITAVEGTTVEIGSTVGELDPSGTPSASPSPAPAGSPAGKAVKVESTAPATGAGASTATDVRMGPAARRLAAETGVDVRQVAGSGPGGLVTKEDVARGPVAAGSTPPHLPPAPMPPKRAEPVARPFTAPGERTVTRQRMTGIRQKIAARLVEAQQTAAILTTFNEADLSRVMELRAKYKESFQKKHGVGLGFMSFFVKASIEALKAFPAVNGRIDGNELLLHNYYDIGVAVSTERGLMVPVIRDADLLSFAGIESRIADYGRRARENAISVDDLQGGTFTITNGGVFGSLLSTPILNPPQSAILGMHSIQKRPVVVDDQIVARPMMYLALSYDHRMVDGREAVSFLVRIKECVENPERLMLEI